MMIDRNLLFAVIALQGDFLTQQQFLEICRQWTTRKQTPIGDLLVQCGWLTTGDRAAVDRCVERKLNRHEGDERATLLAHADDWARHSLLSLADAGITHVMAGKGGPAPRPETRPAPGNLGRRERYDLVSLHAAGGLGHIWIAHDPELDRDVALKEIRPEHESHEATRTRFLAEARVTGRLEHPGVVPVYALSKDGNGRPFYTMRFIQGRTLTDALEAYHQFTYHEDAADTPVDAAQRQLRFRELLQSFIAVCQTVGYAHSKGIMHRDLKTDNVMLGDFGETLLVDWGLAKTFTPAAAPIDVLLPPMPLEGDGDRHPSSSLTQQGNIIGTPMFMAPEQTIGDARLLGPWTDIHALGIMLYVLLTGKAPFTGDVVEVMLTIRNEDPPPPSQWNREVPRALEAVCLKAMAKKPADRYAGAGDLAAEIQRWLADEPVRAYREPWLTRARRGIKRHRVKVVAAAAALLVGVVALLLSTLFLTAANQRERTAKQEALQQRDRADENFDLARSAVDQALSHIAAHPRLRQPDLVDLRRELLASVVPFYEQFVRQRREDPRVEAARGSAYGRLAMVRWELGQEAQSLAEYEEMRRVFQRLVGSAPQQSAYRRELASCLNNLGLLLQNTGRRDEARRAFEEALQLQAQLIVEHPQDTAAQEAAAAGYLNLGTLLHEGGQFAAALAAYGDALQRYRMLREARPEQTDFLHGQATCHNNLGGLLIKQGNRPEAAEHLQQGLALREQLAKHRPEPATLLELARARGNLALCWSQLPERRSESAALYRQAAEQLEGLAKTYPALPEFRRELGVIRQNLGELLHDLGDLAGAERELRLAAASQEELQRQQNTVLTHAVDMGVTYLRLGDVQESRQDSAAALESYSRAIPMLETVLERDPRLTQARVHLREAHGQRAEALARLARHAESLAEWDRALAVLPSGTSPYQVLKACALIRSGDYQAALALVQPHDSIAVNGALLLPLSRFHALAAQHAPAADRPQHADRALALLTQARQEGLFRDRKHRRGLMTEKDFAALRNRPEFQQLLDEVRQSQLLPRKEEMLAAS